MGHMLSPPQKPHAALQAVILAAGRGQRLQEGCEGTLKPLTPLLGLTLLERAVLSCRAVGVSACYVVVGYGKEHIIPHITALARRHKIRIHAIEHPCWQEGNGTSALAVKSHLRGPFLLVMCDHVFDAAILQTLIAVGQTSDACLLAVDHRIDQIFDCEDATKVQLNGQAITAIGKDLPHFDAIDTGLFFCHPLLFTALEQARASGDGSLSGGMRRLTATNKMLAVPIDGHFWIDIDTPESLAYAERLLLSKSGKPHRADVVSHSTNPRAV